MGLSSELSCEAGSFSCCRLNPHWCLQSEVRGLTSLSWSPGLWSLLCSPAVPPSLSKSTCGAAGSATTTLWGLLAAAWPAPFHSLPPCWVPQPPPCCESSPLGCPSPPLLPVWMNVSSLSTWLSEVCTVRFSVSSGCFLFLNCCCPSFGCVRRRSVSIYTSILAGNRKPFTFKGSCV